MIRLNFPQRADDLVRVDVSSVAEAAHSWHVLADPGHHPLQLPWVRACRSLDSRTRRALREQGFVVAHHVPSFLEASARHLDESFDDQLARVAGTPLEIVAAEVSAAVAGANGRGGSEPSDPDGWDRLQRALDHDDDPAAIALRAARERPAEVLAATIDALDRYWRAGFAREWARVEPSLHAEAERLGRRLAHGGVLGLLRSLIPSVSVDISRRSIALPTPHEHDVDVAQRGAVTFAPSHYVWPHVRVTCDAPWPLRVTYPIAPLGPTPSLPPSADQLLEPLRALGADVRLRLLASLLTEPRSTQELAGLLALSPAAVSRHLGQLARAGLVRASREGYYVVYAPDRERLAAIGGALSTWARGA